MEHKYYWLKMKSDFFKRHDIQVLESLPNGKEYAYFYMKLMLESIKHDGSLRFNDTIPYNEQMLSAITNTSIDTVHSAIQVLQQLEMVTLLDDGTYYLSEVNKMIGSSSESDSANRVRRFRERQKQAQLECKQQQALQCNVTSVTKCNEILELDIDKDIDIDKKKILTKVSSKEKTLSFGTYKRVKLTQKQYDKIKKDFPNEDVDLKITQLDEYLEINNNKNKYKDFNLVLRKALRENWFNSNAKKKVDNEPDWAQNSLNRILKGFEE